MLMVKPGMAYLDIVRDVKNKVGTVQLQSVIYLHSTTIIVDMCSSQYSLYVLQHPYHPLAIYQVSTLCKMTANSHTHTKSSLMLQCLPIPHSLSQDQEYTLARMYIAIPNHTYIHACAHIHIHMMYIHTYAHTYTRMHAHTHTDTHILQTRVIKRMCL